MSEALAAWADFPVTAQPRPLVLTPPFGGRVNDPAGGFTATDIRHADDMKTAYGQGSIQAPPSLPESPKTSDDYPIISASQALQILKTPTSSGAAVPVPPLQVTSVSLGVSEFATDRGRIRLPAWLFSFRDVADPAAVLAVAPPDLYLHPDTDFQASGVTWAMSAEVSSSRHTITAHFAGSAAGSGPCTANYALEIATSATAIAVEVIQVAPAAGSAGSASSASTMNVACTAVGYPREATAQLSGPVGNRVVVDAATREPLALATAP